MNKDSIDLTNRKPVKFEFNDTDILVSPYIDLTNKTIYIKNYVQTYFNGIDFISDFLEAEWSLMLSIIGDMTNFEIKEDLDINALIDSGFWYEVRSRIENYDEFRKDLQVVVDYQNKQNELDRSVGAILENLSNKIMVFLDKVMEIDVSSEGTIKLVSELKETMKSFDNTFGQTPAGKTTRRKRVTNKS